ncbi:MAG: YdcF family protein [Lysobacter sp.]|nr:MAG: YdcF family protein [Lysobacter sp.]
MPRPEYDPASPGPRVPARPSPSEPRLSRLDHRLRLFFDPDVLHAGLVAGGACVLSAGLVYVGYFVHVVRIARRAPCAPDDGRCLLLFGKHAPQGRIDADFDARLERAAQLWRERPPQVIVLLGGGADGHPSEAQVAHAALLERGVADDAPLRLEQRSRDTLQNLRNARGLLADRAADEPVTLLSNRYHLARCALFARQLGMRAELCAAEPALRWTPRTLYRLAGEAAYVCWIDIGTRWARRIGHRRMLGKVT